MKPLRYTIFYIRARILGLPYKDIFPPDIEIFSSEEMWNFRPQ
jgi:hypothetical protein